MFGRQETHIVYKFQTHLRTLCLAHLRVRVCKHSSYTYVNSGLTLRALGSANSGLTLVALGSANKALTLTAIRVCKFIHHVMHQSAAEIHGKALLIDLGKAWKNYGAQARFYLGCTNEKICRCTSEQLT